MTRVRGKLHSDTTAAIALLIGGAMWGVYWVPIRFFGDLGLTGSWSGILMYLAALVCVLPFLWGMRRQLRPLWRPLILSGVFTGAAFSLYSTSLVYTDVVRSILLFYLTPVWGTLLGFLYLGERLTLSRSMGLICGIGGLFVVLNGGQGLPWPSNVGDWLALLSGFVWAFGSLGLYQSKAIPIPGQVFAFISGAIFVAVIAILIEAYLGQPMPKANVFAAASPWFALSAVYVLPMLFLTIWPATRLTPARVGLLLMSEVVVGLITAALFADETFGVREAMGAALIVSAAALELRPRPEAGHRV